MVNNCTSNILVTRTLKVSDDNYDEINNDYAFLCYKVSYLVFVMMLVLLFPSKKVLRTTVAKTIYACILLAHC